MILKKKKKKKKQELVRIAGMCVCSGAWIRELYLKNFIYLLVRMWFV